jgi:hypothetical protein
MPRLFAQQEKMTERVHTTKEDASTEGMGTRTQDGPRQSVGIREHAATLKQIGTGWLRATSTENKDPELKWRYWVTILTAYVANEVIRQSVSNWLTAQQENTASSFARDMQVMNNEFAFSEGTVFMYLLLGVAAYRFQKGRTQEQLRGWLRGLLLFCLGAALVLFPLTAWGASLPRGHLQFFFFLLTLLPKTLLGACIPGLILLYLPVRRDNATP